MKRGDRKLVGRRMDAAEFHLREAVRILEDLTGFSVVTRLERTCLVLAREAAEHAMQQARTVRVGMEVEDEVGAEF